MEETRATIARLRLDWELSDDLKGLTKEEVADLMLAQIKDDLEDLIINGDTEHTSDWLLKNFDGAKKRGTEVDEVDIFSAHLFSQYRDKKEMTEYTLYILLAVTWLTPEKV